MSDGDVLTLKYKFIHYAECETVYYTNFMAHFIGSKKWKSQYFHFSNDTKKIAESAIYKRRQGENARATEYE